LHEVKGALNNRLIKGGRNKRQMRYATMVFIAILILLASSTATYHRNAIWSNPETLGKDNIKKSPGKGRVYYNLGNYFVAQDRIDEAIEQFRAAIRVKPTSEEYNNLGLAYESKGMIDAAIDMFQFAISLDASNAEAYNNLGKVYLLYQSRIDEAIQLFTRALVLKSPFADASLNLAAAHIRGRRFFDAIPLLKTVLAKEPGRLDAHYNLGVAYHCLSDAGAAMRELDILRGNGDPLAVRLERFMSRPCDNSTQKLTANESKGKAEDALRDDKR
jgi:tetratricopeptide (TPR) repeat protein